MLAKKYQADAVDMEAYSVADVARIYSIPFRAIKVISDESRFPYAADGTLRRRPRTLSQSEFVSVRGNATVAMGGCFATGW